MVGALNLFDRSFCCVLCGGLLLETECMLGWHVLIIKILRSVLYAIRALISLFANLVFYQLSRKIGEKKQSISERKDSIVCTVRPVDLFYQFPHRVNERAIVKNFCYDKR